MSRRASLGEIVMPLTEASRQFAIAWAEEIVEEVLDLVWKGFDLVWAKELKGKYDLVDLDPEQLERQLTQWHAAEITILWGQTYHGYSSFLLIHEHHDLAQRKGGNAMPPSNDFAFVHRDDNQICLPIEAKLLPSGNALSDYLKDVKLKYIGGAAASLVGECGMIGYLLRGNETEVIDKLSKSLQQPLEQVAKFANRAHRTTSHARTTAPAIRIHHMVMSCVLIQKRTP